MQKILKKRFNILNFEIYTKGKNKKVVGLMKVGGQIMKEFVRLRAKAYSYLKDNSVKHKKVKSTKRVLSKQKLNLKITKTF